MGDYYITLVPERIFIDTEEQATMETRIIAWMQENGESIYEAIGVPDNAYQLRFGQITYRPPYLYMHVFNYPRFPHEIMIVGMPVKVKEVTLLKTGEPLTFIQSYEIARDEYRFRVILPEACPDPLDTVVKVELEEPLTFQPLN